MKNSASNDNAAFESKLIKLEISSNRIKNSNLCHCKSRSNLKQYFNNKSNSIC